jgi:hypothetical protein
MVHGFPSEANICSAMQILHIYETQGFVAMSRGAYILIQMNGAHGQCIDDCGL